MYQKKAQKKRIAIELEDELEDKVESISEVDIPIPVVSKPDSKSGIEATR